MSLLKSLLTEVDDSSLPPTVISKIKSNIAKGARDVNQKWANALELVHKAYEVTNADMVHDGTVLSGGVQRPTPQMTGAWKQYEEMIRHAVDQLQKTRGHKADWRMSASEFREALAEAAGQDIFRVTIHGRDVKDTSYVMAVSARELADSIAKSVEDSHVKAAPNNSFRVYFYSSHGPIRKNEYIEISSK